MTYPETLDYLFNSLPMYHRIGQAAYKADITNTVSLMEHLGHPERKFQSIHVAGTNGKGSVSHMLCSILMRAGYKVGLYTSPHLVDFRERIRINGEMIPKEEVTAFVAQHRPFMEGLQLSFFEMTVGLAFDYFARERVDIAVVEVGMGGRLDSTNVITPLLSVITNIGFDHTQFLGDTLAKIAAEKAGIIKEGVPVVIGQYQPETMPVFEAKAKECHAPISVASEHWRVSPDWQVEHDGVSVGEYPCEMTGSYQLKNVATVLEAVHQLAPLSAKLLLAPPAVADLRFTIHNPQLAITDENIRQGIAHVVTDTGLHGRWETIGENPLTICETAHNADGIEAMLAKLETLPYRRLHLIYGCVNDKDFRHILQMLPRERTTFYYSQPSVPRGLPVDQLSEAAKELGMPGEAFPDVHDAIVAARKAADPEGDLVLVTGSIFLVADALEKEGLGDRQS